MYRTHVREFGEKCLIQELRQSKNVSQRTHVREFGEKCLIQELRQSKNVSNTC